MTASLTKVQNYVQLSNQQSQCCERSVYCYVTSCWWGACMLEKQTSVVGQPILTSFINKKKMKNCQPEQKHEII